MSLWPRLAKTAQVSERAGEFIAQRCVVVTAGRYSLEGSAECTPCAPGRYQSATRQSECKECPPGLKLAVARRLNIVFALRSRPLFFEMGRNSMRTLPGWDCPVCHWQRFLSRVPGKFHCAPSCLALPTIYLQAGRYSKEGALVCLACDPGYYIPPNGTECLRCGPGTVSPGGATSCSECPGMITPCILIVNFGLCLPHYRWFEEQFLLDRS